MEEAKFVCHGNKVWKLVDEHTAWWQGKVIRQFTTCTTLEEVCRYQQLYQNCSLAVYIVHFWFDKKKFLEPSNWKPNVLQTFQTLLLKVILTCKLMFSSVQNVMSVTSLQMWPWKSLFDKNKRGGNWCENMRGTPQGVIHRYLSTTSAQIEFSLQNLCCIISESQGSTNITSCRLDWIFQILFEVCHVGLGPTWQPAVW